MWVKLAGLKSFARGLMADIVAVENGIRMSWSNGVVEGHVNRIKSIKRQMYGRASFELLRRKVILGVFRKVCHFHSCYCSAIFLKAVGRKENR